MANPDLCPTHKIEMEWFPGGYVCESCRIEAYHRITKLKEKAIKLKRIRKLSRFPDRASPFEGL